MRACVVRAWYSVARFAFRYTLVITWDSVTPLEPNAHRLSDAELPSGLAKDVRMLGTGLSPTRRVASFDVVHVGACHATAARFRLRFLSLVLF